MPSHIGVVRDLAAVLAIKIGKEVKWNQRKEEEVYNQSVRTANTTFNYLG